MYDNIIRDNARYNKQIEITTTVGKLTQPWRPAKLISHDLWPKQVRAELNWLQDSESLQQCEYELQVNKFEEIKQWLVKLCKALTQHLREKM